MVLNAIIEKDKDGYFAYIPNLKGCVSEGKTYEETIHNIKEALELYLEDIEEEEKEKLLKSQILITPIEVNV